MRVGVALLLVAFVCGCGSSTPKVAAPPTVANFAVKSALLHRVLYETLVTPAGGGKGRPLLVFLHGYGAAPSDTFDPAFAAALRRLGDRAPVVLLPEGDVSWWHDHAGEPWGSYVLHEAIPAALHRSGADPHRIAIGGISMGGFGALDLDRLEPHRFCAVGGHSPAIGKWGSDEASFAFADKADFERHDLLGFARKRRLYDSPVWLDVGRQDPLRPAVSTLARELKATGQKVSFHSWPGGHEGRYWDAHFARYLRFYADACG
jgi:predicted esterase